KDGTAALFERDVDGDLPDPRLEASLASKPPPLAQSSSKRLLDDIARQVVAADDAREHVAEDRVPLSIELFQRIGLFIHLHLLILTPSVSFSEQGGRPCASAPGMTLADGPPFLSGGWRALRQ